MSTYARMTQVQGTRVFPVGSAVYAVNILSSKLPPLLLAKVRGYDDNDVITLDFQEEFQESLTPEIIQTLCQPVLMVDGLDRNDEVELREIVHEARMIHMASSIQQNILVSPQHLSDTMKELVINYCTTRDNKDELVNEMHNRICLKIEEINENTRRLSKQKPPPNTYPINKGLFEKLVDYATKKAKYINQQYMAFDNDETEISKQFHKKNNEVIFELLEYNEERIQQLATTTSQEDENLKTDYKTDQDEISQQPTIINNEISNKIQFIYEYMKAQQTQTTNVSMPRNIEFTNVQQTTPLTNKTTIPPDTMQGSPAKLPSVVKTPPTYRTRKADQELNYEEDDFGDINLEGSVPLPLPTLKRMKEFSETIRASEFGKNENISKLKSPVQVITAYACYILYFFRQNDIVEHKISQCQRHMDHIA